MKYALRKNDHAYKKGVCIRQRNSFSILLRCRLVEEETTRCTKVTVFEYHRDNEYKHSPQHPIVKNES